jgi:hypothetical protein
MVTMFAGDLSNLALRLFARAIALVSEHGRPVHSAQTKRPPTSGWRPTVAVD